MIETRELFPLNAVRFRHPYDATLKAAIAACDPTRVALPAEANAVPRDKPYHFEIFFNPNEGTPPDEAIVLIMYEDPTTRHNTFRRHGTPASPAWAHRGLISWERWWAGYPARSTNWPCRC